MPPIPCYIWADTYPTALELVVFRGCVEMHNNISSYVNRGKICMQTCKKLLVCNQCLQTFCENCLIFFTKKTASSYLTISHGNLASWDGTYCHIKDKSKCTKGVFHFKFVSKYIQIAQDLYNSCCFAALLGIFYYALFWDILVSSNICL